MAISSACCLNASPPTPAISSSNSKHAQTQDAWNEKWRKQCVLGVACMVIGLQVSHINDSNGAAIAKEISSVAKESNNYSRVAPRWSDMRTCPPWHVNSLETIVPENLPRPSSAHRRWEAIGFSDNAPPPALKVAKGIRTIRNTCFSM